MLFLAGFNPSEAARIRRECSPLQVARAFAFKMSETEGWGYSFSD